MPDGGVKRMVSVTLELVEAMENHSERLTDHTERGTAIVGYLAAAGDL